MLPAISTSFILQAAASSALSSVQKALDAQAPADNATCLDFPLHWVDSEGRSCLYYSQQRWCTVDGGYGPGWGSLTTSTFSSYAHRGHSADGACCACNGGVRGELVEVLRPHLAGDETVLPGADGAAQRPDYSSTTPAAQPVGTTTATTTTTEKQLVRSEIRCYTYDGVLNTYGSWGRPTAPDGTDCYFPFTWGDQTFDECTNEQYDRMWCYVGPDSSTGWGNCKCEELRYQLENHCRTTERTLGATALAGEDCHFPFEFEGRNYTDCTSAGQGEGGQPWCATGATMDAGWGNCACEDVWVDVSSSSANMCIDMIQSFPDLDAWGDDCSYYIGREDQCGQSDTAQFQAGMLCCACGGGHRADHTYSIGDVVLAKNEPEEPWSFMTVSRMIPTMVVPMDSPEGTEEQTFSLLQPCSDSTLWSDVVWGEGTTTCADLAVDNDFGSPSEWCTAYGEASELVRQRCPMVCGTCMEIRGGVREATDEDGEDDSEQAMCSDMDNEQVDTDGDDCTYYQRYPHSCGCCDRGGSSFGSSAAQGFVASELCCACGGGFQGRPGDALGGNP